MNLPRVILADDHAVFSEALGHLLRESYQVVAMVANGRDLLQQAEQLQPDFVVLDIGMPLLNGIEAALRLNRAAPKIRIVVLSMHGDAAHVAQAFKAGAAGYVLKTSPAAEIMCALRCVLAGDIYLDSQLPPEFHAFSLRRNAPRSENSHSQLTARERQVLQLVAEGHSVKEIAYLLHLSPKTIEFHKYNLMKKTMLHNTAALTRLAIRLGIAEGEQIQNQETFPVNPPPDQD